MAAPGFPWLTPGRGLIMMAPVSVCHQVSTTGVFEPPMCVLYQMYASGLIGSPTEPSSRSFDGLSGSARYFAGMSSPHFMNVRIAVGAQYRIVTPYLATISHQRPRCGVSGVPSYMTLVVQLASGP